MNKGEVFLTGMAATVVWWTSVAYPHEVDERYDPGADSVKVQLEIDADNDGVWEVRHVFFDKLMVWDRSSDGRMRVTVTHDGVANSELGLFWRDLTTSPNDSLSQVLLNEFSQFGQAYADTMTVLQSGMKMFESPGYDWYIRPKEAPVDSIPNQ